MEYLNKTNIANYSLFSDKLEKIRHTDKLTINTINQYSYCIAERDKLYQQSLEECDILLPDGFSIVKAVHFLNGEHINKIAGFDMHTYLLEQLNKVGGSCFYLGSSEGTLSKIKERIALQHPAIRVNTFSPPYKKEFSEEDDAAMIDAVNSQHPDVLFIGLAAPKQEKWVFINKSLLRVNLICSVGAVFDYYAGTVKRGSKFWVNHGMEWFIRLVKQPKRMWKRYLVYGPVFIWYIIIMKMRKPMPNLSRPKKSINIIDGSLK